MVTGVDGHYDVVVVGGGSAGCAAAAAASRGGHSVLLVERYGFLGGTGTAVLDSFYGFFTPGAEPRRVVGGIGWEVVCALTSYSAMMIRPSSYGAGAAVTYNPQMLKIVWDDLVLQSGVQVLLHTLCTAVERHSEGWHISMATRTDARTVRASVLIDASGDAQPATWAGAESEPTDAARLQSLTTIFRMVNVDQTASTVKHADLVALMQAADGYDLPRRDGSIHITPIRGSYVANMTRVSGINPLVPEELTAAEIEGRRQALEYVRFLRDCVPGYRDAQLAELSTQIGVRESRRVIGEYTLTRDDVLSARDFPDTVALCGAPIEVHGAGQGTRWEYLPEGQTVGIPLRTLIPRDVRNLLVAGRCLSADHDAHGAVRSMGQCMAMGHAAGATAAIALDTHTAPNAVDVGRVRHALVREGAILD